MADTTSDMAADTAARLTEVEIALAHLERVVEGLSEVARAQGEVIDRLRAEGRMLTRRLAAAEAALPDDSPDPNAPPPHW